MESAFLKDNTDVYDISFQTEKSIKIKIEVDTAPAPLSFPPNKAAARTPFVHDTLFHTARPVCRKDARLGLQGGKKRVKGRDWYDFEWYVRNRVPLDFTHLRERNASSTAATRAKRSSWKN